MRTTAAIVAVAMLTGCATYGQPSTGANWQPMVDGKYDQKYSEDLTVCQKYAASQMSAAEAGIGAALVGAALGGLVSDLLGGDGSTNWLTAGVTAVGAGAQAASGAEQNQRGIIRNCMRGRGHSVLN